MIEPLLLLRYQNTCSETTYAPLVLTVTKDGEYSLAKKVIPVEELQAKLEEIEKA